MSGLTLEEKVAVLASRMGYASWQGPSHVMICKCCGEITTGVPVPIEKMAEAHFATDEELARTDEAKAALEFAERRERSRLETELHIARVKDRIEQGKK